MSWERANPHTCADGFLCKGHKVDVKYTKDPIYGTVRNATCIRCKQNCNTSCIPNQNYRDQTGRSGIKAKMEKVEPVWRDPKTGMTLNEIRKNSDKKLQDYIEKANARHEKEMKELKEKYEKILNEF
jgi:hypothetical protein